jgi:hypothetical protein
VTPCRSLHKKPLPLHLPMLSSVAKLRQPIWRLNSPTWLQVSCPKPRILSNSHDARWYNSGSSPTPPLSSILRKIPKTLPSLYNNCLLKSTRRPTHRELEQPLRLNSIVYHERLVDQLVGPALCQLDRLPLDIKDIVQSELLCSVDPTSTTRLLIPVLHTELDIKDWYLQGLGRPALALSRALRANSLVHTDVAYISSASQSYSAISDNILHGKQYHVLSHSKHKRVMLKQKSPNILTGHLFKDILSAIIYQSPTPASHTLPLAIKRKEVFDS